jgi:hypothetical protein
MPKIPTLPQKKIAPKILVKVSLLFSDNQSQVDLPLLFQENLVLFIKNFNNLK